jgi:hypothetical protein
MIHLTGGIGKRRRDVLVLKERIVLKDLFPCRSGCNQIEHVTHPDTMTPNAGATAALSGFNGDPLQEFHGIKVDYDGHWLNLEIDQAKSSNGSSEKPSSLSPASTKQKAPPGEPAGL